MCVSVRGSGIVPDWNGSSEDDNGQKALKQNALLSLTLKESAGSYYGNMLGCLKAELAIFLFSLFTVNL